MCKFTQEQCEPESEVPAAEGQDESDSTDLQKLQHHGAQAWTGDRSQGTTPRLPSILVSQEECLPRSVKVLKQCADTGGQEAGRKKERSEKL